MQSYEYKVVPAPKKGLRGKGVRSSEDKFANALQGLMNELGEQGWEYQRTDTLPLTERKGLSGKNTTYQNMMVFRRTLAAAKTQDVVIDAVPEPIAEPIVTKAPKVAAEPVTTPDPEIKARPITPNKPSSMPKISSDDQLGSSKRPTIEKALEGVRTGRDS